MASQFRTDRPVGPAGVLPPGQRPLVGRHRRSRHGARHLTIIVVAAGAVVAISGAQVRITPTSAQFTSAADPQVNTMKAWVQTTQSSCNPAVDETTALRTASCQVTVTNRGKRALTLDVAVQTNSASPKNPADYFDGSPTDPHPKSDPKHGVPDYSENLYITDSNNNHFGFGLVTCSVPVPKTTSTCSSSLTTPSAVTLQPGNSDTFTVTVHLNHGGHNGGTLTVDLKANVGAGTLGALLTTFGLS